MKKLTPRYPTDSAVKYQGKVWSVSMIYDDPEHGLVYRLFRTKKPARREHSNSRFYAAKFGNEIEVGGRVLEFVMAPEAELKPAHGGNG